MLTFFEARGDRAQGSPGSRGTKKLITTRPMFCWVAYNLLGASSTGMNDMLQRLSWRAIKRAPVVRPVTSLSVAHPLPSASALLAPPPPSLASRPCTPRKPLCAGLILCVTDALLLLVARCWRTQEPRAGNVLPSRFAKVRAESGQIHKGAMHLELT